MVALGGSVLGGGAIAGSIGADRLDDLARAGLLRADAFVSVGRRAVSRPISPGFVGLSVEYPAVTAYAGAEAVDQPGVRATDSQPRSEPTPGYDETHFLSSDGDHPNAAGHAQIAKAVDAVLEKALG